MRFYFNAREVKQTRRNLRKKIPEPEGRLWYYLRDRRFHNIKFRRQYSVGRYVADFYCPSVRLAIEIDGDSHFTDEAQEYDKQREDYVSACGIKTIRFTNSDVKNNLDGVLEAIAAAVLPHP